MLDYISNEIVDIILVLGECHNNLSTSSGIVP